MKHILFVGVTQWSQARCARAVALGHRVSLITLDGGRSGGMLSDPAARGRCADAHDIQALPPGQGLRPLAATMAEIHAAAPIDAVLVNDEVAIEATAMACASLGIRFTAEDGVGNARDKARARRLLDAAGLASVPYERAADASAAVAAARGIGYPVVVKPVRGSDSWLTSRADSASAVRAAARRIVRHQRAAILVERYLPGRLVWLDIARAGGESRVVAIIDRSAADDDECRDIGAVLPASLGPYEAAQCRDYADLVCAALGLDLGLFHLDLALTPAGPVLIEANPRMMGGVLPLLYRFATGIDVADVAIGAHLGTLVPERVGLAVARSHAAVRKVVACRGGRINQGLDVARLTAAMGADEFVNRAIQPGRRLRPGQVAAAILTGGSTGASAAAAGDAALDRLARLIGVDLVRASSRGAESRQEPA